MPEMSSEDGETEEMEQDDDGWEEESEDEP
jgi:hypothetical protein